MSWLTDLRELPRNTAVWYDAVCALNHVWYTTMVNICPYTIIPVKPALLQLDIMKLQNKFLIDLIQREYPHLDWLRTTFENEKVAAIYTPTAVAKTVCVVKPGSGTFLQGFMFADDADAVTFKLMWSKYLC